MRERWKSRTHIIIKIGHLRSHIEHSLESTVTRIKLLISAWQFLARCLLWSETKVLLKTVIGLTTRRGMFTICTNSLEQKRENMRRFERQRNAHRTLIVVWILSRLSIASQRGKSGFMVQFNANWTKWHDIFAVLNFILISIAIVSIENYAKLPFLSCRFGDGDHCDDCRLANNGRLTAPKWACAEGTQPSARMRRRAVNGGQGEAKRQIAKKNLEIWCEIN